MAVAIEEQETVIGYYRDEKYCTVYTSDTTVMTKLDKKVKTSKDWEVIKIDKFPDGSIASKTYKAPKRLISFRGTSTSRTMTPEERQKAAERLRVAREKKKEDKNNED